MADPLRDSSSLIGQLYTQLQTENAKVAEAKPDSDGFVSKLFRRFAPKQTSSNPEIDEKFLKETDRLKSDFVGLDPGARIEVARQLILANENKVKGAEILARALHLEGLHSLSSEGQFPSEWNELKGEFKRQVQLFIAHDKEARVEEAIGRCGGASKAISALQRMWNSAKPEQQKKMAISLFQELGIQLTDESTSIERASKQVKEELEFEQDLGYPPSPDISSRKVIVDSELTERQREVLSERADTISRLQSQFNKIEHANEPEALDQLYGIHLTLSDLKYEWEQNSYGLPLSESLDQLSEDVKQQIDVCAKEMRLNGDLQRDKITALAKDLMEFLESSSGERVEQLRDEFHGYGQTVSSQGYGPKYPSHAFWATGSSLIHEAEESKDDSRIAEAHAMSQNAADFIEQNKQELFELGWKPEPHLFWHAMK